MNNFRSALLLALLLAFGPLNLFSYSVLTHEAVVDAQWTESIQPLLKERFPALSDQDLKTAHSFAYGGSVIQDIGYYTSGSDFFTDLVHYVRSGDFVAALLREARNANEYAFALGALAHYASDNTGHPLAVNKAVPLLYPKLGKKFGENVTYADDPSAHLNTEFGFDVLEVAKGHYTPDAYREFIGFEVSRPVLQVAFRDTYGLDLDDVFSTLDVAIGTYRRTVSSIITKMTQVAWDIKKDQIQKDIPEMTREKFLFSLSKTEYEKAWGDKYQAPGFSSRALERAIQIAPKIGPLSSLEFRTPTPETEKLFDEGFNATIERYRALIAAGRSGSADLPDLNLDLGKPTTAGMYKPGDAVYAELVHRLAGRKFAGISPPLKEQILAFYESATVPTSPKKGRKEWMKLQADLQALKEK